MPSIYEESHNELKEFIEWFNRIYGHHPIVIGGWAVYHYNPYFESKDIDVVFESARKTWDQQILSYFASHGYVMLDKEKHELTADAASPALVQTFRKKTAGEYIDIDACSTSDANLFHDPAHRGKEVPYALAAKQNAVVTIPGTQSTYRVPGIELLLLYKLKAYNDRDYRLKHAATQQEIQWLQSKRDKDGADIIALLDENHCKQKIDFRRMLELIRKLGLHQMVWETLDKVFGNDASINKYAKIARPETSALCREVMKKIGSATPKR